jgi:cytoskeleton protein RodZ
VFARGFLRNYARLVKLDPEVLLASGEHRLHPAAQREPEFPHSVNIPFPTGRELKWRKYAIAVPVLLVLVVLAGIFEAYREERNQAAATLVPQAAAVSDAEVKPALTLDATALSGKAATEKSAPPAYAAAVERKPGEQLLKLTFDTQSWVEIHDRTGRRIFSRLNAAGTEQWVSGEPPLTLVVGNARGVRLTRNGQPVDLAPHTNVSVARLTLE